MIMSFSQFKKPFRLSIAALDPPVFLALIIPSIQLSQFGNLLAFLAVTLRQILLPDALRLYYTLHHEQVMALKKKAKATAVINNLDQEPQ